MSAAKKILAVLLLLAMCLFTLIGCQDEPPATEDDGGNTPTDPNREGAPKVEDLGGYEFVIRNDSWDNYEVAAPVELNGQGINDVVYQRNKEVEKLYNITIKENGDPDTSSSGSTNFLSQMASSGDQFADLYSYDARYMISTHAVTGYFVNIYDLKSWDLTKDRWDQAFIEEMTINGHAYTLTGNIQTNDELHQLTLATNLSLFEQSFPDSDLHKIVTEGDWTWETFTGFFQGFGQDLGARGKVDMEDKIGFCYAAGMSSFFYASGIRTFTMENGEPVLNVKSDKSIDLTVLMEEIFSGNMDTAEFSSAIGGSVLLDYELRLNHFRGGNMLFTTFLFTDALQCLDVEDDLVYLPYPKFNKDQEKYLTPMQPFFEPLAISANVLDTERSALITDALAFYSDDLQEEVADVLLQERLTHEVKPRELMMMNFDSKVYDMDYIANITGFDTAIIQMVQRASFGTYSSSMTTLEGKAINAKGRGALQNFVKKYTAH